LSPKSAHEQGRKVSMRRYGDKQPRDMRRTTVAGSAATVAQEAAE
jgi:hypothetical protein